MFTGIVEELGSIAEVRAVAEGYELVVRAKAVLDGTQLGDSIAINGTCLTVTELGEGAFRVGVAPETRSLTNLIHLKKNDPVNLERAVTPQTRLGGHMVQGHVDGVGTLVEKRPDRESLRLKFECAPELMKYVVVKGFISLDGASLTVVKCWDNAFSVMLVPYSQKHLILSAKHCGYKVNIEVDIIGKYVEKLLAGRVPAPQGITQNTLESNGFV